eukprot:8835689-Pyramimonas_sp.AAC.1
MHFPPVILYMELLQCVSPRVLSQLGGDIRPIPAHAQHRPRAARVVEEHPLVSHRVWVDDLSQQVPGGQQAAGVPE